MGLYRSINGIIQLEVISADVPGMLAALAEQNIPVFSVRTVGELKIRMEICRRYYHDLARISRKRGESIRIIGRRGLYWPAIRLFKRPLLLIGIGLFLAAVLYLPGRVLFVEVEGNVQIPENLILEAAETCGIRFGASRREVRSEHIKNALIEAVPQLAWVGVNTDGCVATISVRERTAEEDPQEQPGGVSSIVASCDGVVLSGTVTSGSGLFRPGQAVKAGQVLISGYSDLGLCIRACRAEGEVFARTRRLLRVVAPGNLLQKKEILDTTTRYSLLVGKNQINLWKGSGICDGSCDRMYEEYYVTLPGDFQLPVGLVKETIGYRGVRALELDQEEAENRLNRFAREYLLRQMVSGEILASDTEIYQDGDVYVLEGEYLCTEMIGRQRQEKIGE